MKHFHPSRYALAPLHRASVGHKSHPFVNWDAGRLEVITRLPPGPPIRQLLSINSAERLQFITQTLPPCSTLLLTRPRFNSPFSKRLGSLCSPIHWRERANANLRRRTMVSCSRIQSSQEQLGVKAGGPSVAFHRIRCSVGQVVGAGCENGHTRSGGGTASRMLREVSRRPRVGATAPAALAGRQQPCSYN